MAVKTITFFNNKGGVGKTTMVYHVAWMLSQLGKRVVAVDLDPQSNLSSMFLDPERLEYVVEDETSGLTILDSITPLVEGEGYKPVHIEPINERIGLVIGNLALSTFEDTLSDAWLKCLAKVVTGFKITSVFNTIIDDASNRWNADYVLVDVGPNLGAINRAVLISSDRILLPVASDLFSLQGIKNLGRTLRQWREDWAQRKSMNPKPDTLVIPDGDMQPMGYVLMQYAAKENRPVQSYLKWANRIPQVYAEFVLQTDDDAASIDRDPNCVGLLKHYRSLAPLAMEAHKPIFLLKPSDGAIGAHMYAAQKSFDDFKQITERIMERCG